TGTASGDWLGHEHPPWQTPSRAPRGCPNSPGSRTRVGSSQREVASFQFLSSPSATCDASVSILSRGSVGRPGWRAYYSPRQSGVNKRFKLRRVREAASMESSSQEENEKRYLSVRSV